MENAREGKRAVCVREAGNGKIRRLTPIFHSPSRFDDIDGPAFVQLTVLAAATAGRAGDVWKAWDPTRSSERRASLSIVYCFVVAGVVCFGFWILRVCAFFCESSWRIFLAWEQLGLCES